MIKYFTIEDLLKHYLQKKFHILKKKIRVHDLRYSHASLLIEMGCQPLLIADRLGHEKIQTTLNTYSHLYPNKQAEVAAQLENVMNGTTVPNGSQMAGVANL